MFCSLLGLSIATLASAGDPWVVIAAGSNGYQNYRHQADACHAYHVALSRGVPSSNIILMMFDDIAGNEGNPFPNKLFNTANGTDVYAGCKLAYRQMDVSMANFFKVLHGDASAGGAVLKSGPTDDVFIVYTDHGAPGYVTFPSGPAMHASDLSAALATMHAKGMYGRLLLYMDACNSGSMFEGAANAPPPNALVVTAANDHEDSWAAFCPPYDKVRSENDRETFSCLGDVFTIAWMLDASLGTSLETVGAQIDRAVAATTAMHTPPSHPMQFGNASMRAEAVAIFEGAAKPLGGASAVVTAAEETIQGVVSTRDVPLHLATWRHARAVERGASAERVRSAAAALAAVRAARAAADARWARVAALAREPSALTARVVFVAEADVLCYKKMLAFAAARCGGAMDDYEMKYSGVLVTLCARVGVDATAAAVAAACA